MISTDKGVSPLSVMAVLAKFNVPIALMKALRIGNVFGSEGHAVPRFREQISRGGPVTVAHRDIGRYFITMAEAVRLILATDARQLRPFNEGARGQLCQARPCLNLETLCKLVPLLAVTGILIHSFVDFNLQVPPTRRSFMFCAQLAPWNPDDSANCSVALADAYPATSSRRRMHFQHLRPLRHLPRNSVGNTEVLRRDPLVNQPNRLTRHLSLRGEKRRRMKAVGSQHHLGA